MSHPNEKNNQFPKFAWQETDNNLKRQIEYPNTLIDNLNEVFYTYDTEGFVNFGNQKSYDALGYKYGELIGCHILDFVPDEDKEKVRKGMLERLVHGVSGGYEQRVIHRSGSLRIFRLNVSPIKEDGNIVGGMVLAEDITERAQAETDRKKMEQDLAAEKERLAVTLGSIAEGVIATNVDGEIRLINSVAENMIGYPDGQAIGRQLTDVFKVLDQDLSNYKNNLLKTVLETRKVLELDDCILQGPDGQHRLLTISAAPMKDVIGGIVGAVLVFRDITDKSRFEQELQKASKLESLGVLAGGIAHDFNNLLTVILGNITLIKELAADREQILEHLNEIEKGTSQARSLTQQLLTFARGGDPVKQTVYLADMVRNTASFALSGSNVRCEFSLPADLWPADIDEGQIGQVINNLVLNATQAMPDGGLINIRGENLEQLGDGELPVPEGKYIKLSVQDRGLGIPEEIRSKIFDPYFTTKANGSGLGLATSYSIVKNHKGYMGVESRVGEGSTFFIYLPIAKDLSERIKQTENHFSPGQGRVLVMDDEPQVLNVLGRMLQAIGYAVVMTADGSEAIVKYIEAFASDKKFDAVILDLTVPGGMGGGETIQRLRRIDPGIKAIVSSGYSNDKIMAEYLEWGFKGVLPKPYGIKDLGEVLDRLLNGESQ